MMPAAAAPAPATGREQPRPPRLGAVPGGTTPTPTPTPAQADAEEVKPQPGGPSTAGREPPGGPDTAGGGGGRGGRAAPGRLLGGEGEKLCEDGAEGGRLRKGRGERTNGTDGCKSEGVQGGGALEGGQARGRRREGKAAKGEREPSRQNSFFGLFGWSEKSGPRGKGKWCLMRRFYGLTWEGLPGDSSSLRMTFLGGGAGRGQEGAGATFYTSCERKPEKPSERQKTSNGRKRSLSTFSFPPQSLSHLEVGSIHRPGRESPAARCRPLLLPAAAAAAAEHGAKRVK